MKIGIFGGSFDPPHVGHEAIVNESLKKLDMDKLMIVPTYLSPFKHEFFLPAATRLQLLEKLFQSNEKIEVCDYEVKQGRPVFSIETVRYLQAHYKCTKIYLIIGEDNLEKLHLWHEFDALKQLVEFVVATRNSKDSYATLYPGFKRLNINIDTSSSSIKKELDVGSVPKTIQEDLKNIIHKV